MVKNSSNLFISSEALTKMQDLMEIRKNMPAEKTSTHVNKSIADEKMTISST